MKNCRFNLAFPGDSKLLFQHALRDSSMYNAKVKGDHQEGMFEVIFLGSKIIGTYSITGTFLNVVILSKPILISCKSIESLVKNYISTH